MIKEKLNSSKKISIFAKRVSVSALRTERKGVITVEAAMAIPIFLFAVLTLVYLFEIMAIKTCVKDGLYCAGKIVAKDAYVGSILIPEKIESEMVSYIGEKRLNQSIIENGSGGFSCLKSYMSFQTGEGKLIAEYHVKTPFPGNSITIKQREEIPLKGWTGYQGGYTDNVQEETVYMTETGMVYHTNYHCTHLSLSISTASKAGIKDERNESGGKYYPCERCITKGSNLLYITATGSRYHGNIDCSGLKRNIYSVPLAEVVGKGACKRCSN